MKKLINNKLVQILQILYPTGVLVEDYEKVIELSEMVNSIFEKQNPGFDKQVIDEEFISSNFTDEEKLKKAKELEDKYRTIIQDNATFR